MRKKSRSRRRGRRAGAFRKSCGGGSDAGLQRRRRPGTGRDSDGVDPAVLQHRRRNQCPRRCGADNDVPRLGPARWPVQPHQHEHDGDLPACRTAGRGSVQRRCGSGNRAEFPDQPDRRVGGLRRDAERSDSVKPDPVQRRASGAAAQQAGGGRTQWSAHQRRRHDAWPGSSPRRQRRRSRSATFRPTPAGRRATGSVRFRASVEDPTATDGTPDILPDIGPITATGAAGTDIVIVNKNPGGPQVTGLPAGNPVVADNTISFHEAGSGSPGTYGQQLAGRLRVRHKRAGSGEAGCARGSTHSRSRSSTADRWTE